MALGYVSLPPECKGNHLEENKRIVVEWNADSEEPTTIEWNFTDRNDNTTYVSITNYGFKGDDESIVNEGIGPTEGFTFVLAGAKAYLEHDIQLNLVADKFPDGLKM